MATIKLEPVEMLPREKFESHFTSTLVLLLLVVTIALIVFFFIDWQREGFHKVGLLQLLSYANFYDDEKVCTRGYYVKTEWISIIKVSLSEDEFTRSAWVRIQPGSEILATSRDEPRKYIDVLICGLFETGRAQAFGSPPIWNHQITAEKIETIGKSKPYIGTY